MHDDAEHGDTLAVFGREEGMEGGDGARHALNIFHAGEAEFVTLESEAAAGNHAQALVRMHLQRIKIGRRRNALVVLATRIDPHRRGRPK